jgi:uncharacterized membrane protein
MWMTERKLRRFIDPERITQCIQNAESKTSGEIRVSVSSFFFGDPERRARRTFVRLGMAKTRHRNGVLIFVVPSRKRFVILGDAGIHEKVGQAFWDQAKTTLAEHFLKAKFTEGLEAAITQLGDALALHFPPDDDGPNELPNAIDQS